MGLRFVPLYLMPYNHTHIHKHTHNQNVSFHHHKQKKSIITSSSTSSSVCACVCMYVYLLLSPSLFLLPSSSFRCRNLHLFQGLNHFIQLHRWLGAWQAKADRGIRSLGRRSRLWLGGGGGGGGCVCVCVCLCVPVLRGGGSGGNVDDDSFVVDVFDGEGHAVAY